MAKQFCRSDESGGTAQYDAIASNCVTHSKQNVVFQHIRSVKMKTLKVKMANCYGIKQLETEFDFKDSGAYAIYAPNGAMKSSFAKTFKDASEGTVSADRIFPNRACARSLSDENDIDIPRDAIFVVTPYDEEFGHSEKTSTLLVNNELRREYEQLHIEIDKAEDALLAAMKKQSGSRKDLRQEISSTFTSDEHSFQTALRRIREEVAEIKDTPWADIVYDTVFDEKVLTMLGRKNVKSLLHEYMNKYNELLNKSTYFKRGVFNYYNASTIAKSLADNGFFSAKHVVRLNAEEPREIKNEKELEELISKEKEAITNDATLRKTYLEIETLLNKNAQCRDFEAYLASHPKLLPRLENVKSLKEDIWKSYLKTHEALYIDLLDKIQQSEKRKKEIEKQAEKERTQWEEVIEIFNDRFFVPFTLVAQNRTAVLLGHESLLDLGFVFNDGTESMEVPRGTLLQVLSTGEKKALYILNIIFEVEVRKKTGMETVFVFDDIADSFDYKNKYAIIQYMQDISDEKNFNQIILTHNFDFFRTIASRFIKYSNCLMTLKSETKVELSQAVGIKNIFMNDWKVNFFKDNKKKNRLHSVHEKHS